MLGGVSFGACGVSVDANNTPPEGDGWTQLELAQYAGLEVAGSVMRVERPEVPLSVWVWHREPGQYTAVWSVCTHGACEVEPRTEDAWYECPCHGSRFDVSGQVLVGPAVKPLRPFEVRKWGNSLFLRKMAA